MAEPSHSVEPRAVPEGTFVKERPQDHPLSSAADGYFKHYHLSSSKQGRFGKVVGIDEDGGEYASCSTTSSASPRRCAASSGASWRRRRDGDAGRRAGAGTGGGLRPGDGHVVMAGERFRGGLDQRWA